MMIYTLDKLNEMSEGDQEFIETVVAVFLQEVPADLERLEEEIKSKNHDQIYKLAHKIKPNVDLLGMEPARKCALEIETMGKNAMAIDLIENRFPLLKQDIQTAIDELKRDFGLS